MSLHKICECERCGEILNPKTAVYLELNCRTNLYSDQDKGPLPEEESQGGFPFGKDCARAVLVNGGKCERIRRKS